MIGTKRTNNSKEQELELKGMMLCDRLKMALETSGSQAIQIITPEDFSPMKMTQKKMKEWMKMMRMTMKTLRSKMTMMKEATTISENK